MTKRELINKLESLALHDDTNVYLYSANELEALDINSVTIDFCCGDDDKFIVLSDMSEA